MTYAIEINPRAAHAALMRYQAASEEYSNVTGRNAEDDLSMLCMIEDNLNEEGAGDPLSAWSRLLLDGYELGAGLDPRGRAKAYEYGHEADSEDLYEQLRTRGYLPQEEA